MLNQLFGLSLDFALVFQFAVENNRKTHQTFIWYWLKWCVLLTSAAPNHFSANNRPRWVLVFHSIRHTHHINGLLLNREETNSIFIYRIMMTSNYIFNYLFLFFFCILIGLKASTEKCCVFHISFHYAYINFPFRIAISLLPPPPPRLPSNRTYVSHKNAICIEQSVCESY